MPIFIFQPLGINLSKIQIGTYDSKEDVTELYNLAQYVYNMSSTIKIITYNSAQ